MPLSATQPRGQVEALEARRLLADPWGASPRLVRLDEAIAQNPSINGRDQAIAIIDTGVDYTHPFLGGGFGRGHKVVGGWDFVDNDPDPMDTYGHGTQVAGVIAAEAFTLNGHRYRGIAPRSNIVALRVDAANDPVPDEVIRNALQWVLDHQGEFNIVAVNISFGSGHYSGEHTSIYSTTLAKLKSAGIFVAAASGNGGVSDPFGVEYPAADPSVYAVGAVDEFDLITEYTERGTNLDLLAPGQHIATTGLGPDQFVTASGTSFATPYVTGTVALLRQANPDLRVQDLHSILSASGKTNIDGDSEFGSVTNLSFQRLDIASAINLALARRRGPLGSTGDVASAAYTNDLAYDPFGVLHMAYYDGIAKTLKYVVRGADGGVSTDSIVDPSPNDIGGYLSIAVDSLARPAIAYFDGHAGDLRFAHFDGDQWNVQIVDFKRSVGLYPSLTFDKSDRPVISYYHKSNGDLRVARLDGEFWNIMTVDYQGDVGRSTDIALNGRTGELAIAYEDSTRGRLKTARDHGEGWTRGQADTTTRGVAHISIAFDGNDQPAVSYYDIHAADLKYATFDGTQWTSLRLASKGAVGLYTNLAFDASGNANIIYYNRRNNLVAHLFNTSGFWDAKILQLNGGRYIAATTRPGDGALTYSWFEPGPARLRVADV